MKTAWADMVYSFTTIDVPGASPGSTSAYGINNSGQIVGSFTDATGSHGFIDKGGSFTTIDVTGTTGGTQAHGINDSGQIVGGYSGGGFLYTDGSFTTIHPSGPPGPTQANGINDGGQIVGSYYTGNMGRYWSYLCIDGNFVSISLFPQTIILSPTGSTIAARS